MEEHVGVETGGQPKVPVVARAICKLDDGEQRIFYATRFSLDDLFVLSMRPPPVGTEMKVTLCPLGLRPLPTLAVRVVSTILDPGDAGRCGFGAIITTLDEDSLVAVHDAMLTLGLASTDEGERRPSIERRQDPRVWIDLRACLTVSDVKFEVRVVNLSLSGALVHFDTDAVPPEFRPGMVVDLDFIHEWAPEIVSVSATIVRLVGVGRPTGIGLRFNGMETQVEARLEGIILYVLGDLGTHSHED